MKLNMNTQHNYIHKLYGHPKISGHPNIFKDLTKIHDSHIRRTQCTETRWPGEPHGGKELQEVWRQILRESARWMDNNWWLNVYMLSIWFPYKENWLVVDIPTPLKKYGFVNWEDDSQYMEN